MTQIINLPELTTLTNALIFPTTDLSDNNRTKKISLTQLIALSAGPRGLPGIQGPTGPTGPTGPQGPSANQSVNTNSNVIFSSMTVTNTSTGITFGDGTVQITAYKKNVRDLTEFSVGNISFTAQELTSPMLTGNPPVNGRNLYLPTAEPLLAGMILVIRNRSASYTFTVWGGLANLGTVNSSSAIQVACDGYSWFTV